MRHDSGFNFQSMAARYPVRPVKAFLLLAYAICLPAIGTQVTSRTETTSSSGPAPSGTFSFPQFSSDLGALESVSLTLDPVTRIEATVIAMNTGDLLDQVSVDF